MKKKVADVIVLIHVIGTETETLQAAQQASRTTSPTTYIAENMILVETVCIQSLFYICLSYFSFSSSCPHFYILNTEELTTISALWTDVVHTAKWARRAMWSGLINLTKAMILRVTKALLVAVLGMFLYSHFSLFSCSSLSPLYSFLPSLLSSLFSYGCISQLVQRMSHGKGDHP